MEEVAEAGFEGADEREGAAAQDEPGARARGRGGEEVVHQRAQLGAGDLLAVHADVEDLVLGGDDRLDVVVAEEADGGDLEPLAVLADVLVALLAAEVEEAFELHRRRGGYRDRVALDGDLDLGEVLAVGVVEVLEQIAGDELIVPVHAPGGGNRAGAGVAVGQRAADPLGVQGLERGFPGGHSGGGCVRWSVAPGS